MPSFASISPDKLARLIGTPAAPRLADVRDDTAFETDPFLVPGSVRRDWAGVADRAPEFTAGAVTICQKGKKLSEGAAAWLRTEGNEAEILEGGIDAWRGAGLPLVPAAALAGKGSGGSVWVTRSRPKIDRIACPWLIRRFVDPTARFLFVAASEVKLVAERFDAEPFDIEGVHWSHRGELCTFDVMVEEFGLALEPLRRLATIVRGADTARPELAPEVPVCSRCHLACPACTRTTLSSSKQAWRVNNVFTPGGLNNLSQMYEVDFPLSVIEALERKVETGYRGTLNNRELATF